MPDLPPDLQRILRDSFYIRTTLTRRDGSPRTIETTYYWDGGQHIVLSGYPGKRDWVASMSRKPDVTMHTVEFEPGYDIAASARVLRTRNERLPYLMKFIERWTVRPNFPRRRVQFFLWSVRTNRRLRLPWWGPFYFARKIFDGMPCVVITFTGEPVKRDTGPPPLSEPREGRPY
jgi:hypothetical protein